METIDYYWIDRFIEVLCFIILGFVAFQKKRPVFFLVVLLLNTLPDLWMMTPQARVHWITPPPAAPTHHTRWIHLLHDHAPQSALTTVLHPLIQKIPAPEVVPLSAPADLFNAYAFYARVALLVIVLLLFLIDHVYGVAGIGALLFPLFYFLQRLFQGWDFIFPFQFARQFALFRQNPKEYYISLPANPSGMLMVVLAVGFISLGLVGLYYFSRRQSRIYNVHIPNPENYQVMLNDKRYDYGITPEGVVVQSLLFKRSDAFHNQATPFELHFASGTVLYFVKREE